MTCISAVTWRLSLSSRLWPGLRLRSRRRSLATWTPTITPSARSSWPTGRGFTEPFIWNYLDDPQALPRPSHQYWMPLPSILAALSMRVLGVNFRAAQVPFVLLSALLPVIAYAIAWQTSVNRRHAWAAALFTLFSGFFVAGLVAAGDVRAVCRVRGVVLVGGRQGRAVGLCRGRMRRVGSPDARRWRAALVAGAACWSSAGLISAG